MLDQHLSAPGATLGADAGYDVASFVAALRERGITPHIAQTRDKRRRSAVDGRTTRHDGYAVSQRIRKRIEEIFGWAKTVACFRKTRFRGQRRTQLAGISSPPRTTCSGSRSCCPPETSEAPPGLRLRAACGGATLRANGAVGARSSTAC